MKKNDKEVTENLSFIAMSNSIIVGEISEGIVPLISTYHGNAIQSCVDRAKMLYYQMKNNVY